MAQTKKDDDGATAAAAGRSAASGHQGAPVADRSVAIVPTAKEPMIIDESSFKEVDMVVFLPSLALRNTILLPSYPSKRAR